MTQIFTEDGTAVPTTIIEAGPVTVTQVKDKDKDGYEALQFGYGETKKIKKPQKGHLKDLENLRVLKEFKIQNSKFKIQEKDPEKGDKIDVSAFSVGDTVKISGKSKAKGFQGVVKRHGFKGAPKSHGHKGQLRRPGSIGQRFPQHTLKGLRMAGRMGGVKSTMRGLKVISIDKDNNLIAVKGAVPGRRGTLLEIQKINN